MWYPIKTPFWAKMLYPNMLWSMPKEKKPKLYLSFDDGPIPEVTPWVLEQLKCYHAKASFFCIGHNVEKHSHVFEDILQQGHSIGNHTYNHLNGWKYSTTEYMENVAACAQLVKSALFRPPYGRLRYTQSRRLRAAGYKIVLWDILAGDFDLNLSGEDCLNNILHHTQKGSIIVLHDSLKAWPRLEYLLPRVLKHYSEQGFSFEAIPM